MANWTNIFIDTDTINENESKGIVVDREGVAKVVDLPSPYVINFNNTMYIELPFTGFGYKVYVLRSNSESYQYYDDVTAGVEVGVLHKNNTRNLIIKSDNPITGYVQIY